MEPRKNLSMAQEDINIEIHMMDFKYIELNNTFKKIMGAWIWKDEDDAASYNSTHNKLILELKNAVDSMWQGIVRLNSQLSEKKYYHNKFLLLKIKIQILLGKLLHVSNFHAKAVDVLSGSLYELNRHMSNKKFNFDSDFLFQKEVEIAYRRVSSIVESNPYFENLLVFLDGVMHFFSKKCANNVVKLRCLDFQIVDAHVNNNGSITPMERKKLCDDFNNTYLDTIRLTKLNMEKNPLDTELKLIFIQANYIALKMKGLTHANAVWKYDEENKIPYTIDKVVSNITNENFEKFFKSWINWRKDYIEPSIAILKEINIKDLIENIDFTNELWDCLEQFRETLKTHILLMTRWSESTGVVSENSFALVNQLGLENVRLKELVVNLCEFLDRATRFSVITTYSIDLKKVNKDAADYKNKVETYKNNLASEALKKGNELISKEAIPKKNKIISISNSKTEFLFVEDQVSSDDSEEPNDFSVETQTELCQSLLLLEKLDSYSAGFSGNLLSRIETIHKTLSKALNRFLVLTKLDRQFLFDSIKNIILEYNHLQILYKKYQDLSETDEIKNKPDIQNGIQHGKSDINQAMTMINSKISESLNLFNEVYLSHIKQREDFIYKLGLSAVKKNQLTGLVHSEIMAFGKAEFESIGLQNRQSGIEVSDFSKDIRLFENLKKYCGCLSMLYKKSTLGSNAMELHGFFKTNDTKSALSDSISYDEHQLIIGELLKNQFSITKNEVFLKQALAHYQQSLLSLKMTEQHYFCAQAFLNVAILKEMLGNALSKEEIINDYESARAAFVKVSLESKYGIESKKQVNFIQEKLVKLNERLSRAGVVRKP